MAAMIGSLAKEKWATLGSYLILVLILGVSEAASFFMLYRSFSLLLGSPIPSIYTAHGLTLGETFTVSLLLVLLLQLIAGTCRALSGVLSGRFAANCQAKILPEIHRYILKLNYGYVSGIKVGDLAYQASIAPAVVNLEIEERVRIISEVMLIFVYLIVLIRISIWMLLMACALGIGIGVTQAWLRPQIRLASKQVEEHRKKVNSSLTADLQALKLIHSNAAHIEATIQFGTVLQGLETKLSKLSAVRSLLLPVAEFLPIFAAVVLGITSWNLSSGRPDLLIPGLATFVLALQRMNVRLAKIAVSINSLTENKPRLELLNQLLCSKGKVFRRQGGKSFAGLQRDICFANVNYRYPNRQHDALHAISFTLPRRGTVALVGSSGAGKSTVVDLLVGLMEPTSGVILVDGQDLQTLSLDQWQQHLGVVSQDVLMVHDTIAANIAFGMAGEIATEQIRAAAHAACAHDFIAQLPEGYNTVIGEQGHQLSGGQRQRISLARAILRQPQILILDEATSALDSHSEARVHQAVEAFSHDRTVLAVAHRLSSIRQAQLILVMEAGRIVERGTHNQLLAIAGVYAELWKRHIHGGEPDDRQA